MTNPVERVAIPSEGPKLTGLSPSGGCACKMPQSALRDLLDRVHLPSSVDAEGAQNLLIGLEAPDDAAVYAIDHERALIVTTDFQTPVVDDPFEWGRVAAANALSDVYAMGGRPLMALNLLGWPEGLPSEMLEQVLAGGQRAVSDAGALVAGGHSIVDAVPKFGLAVIGEAPRESLITKGGGRAGDLLVLTKPLGVGVVATAIKRDQAPSGLIDAAIESMARLNANAAAAAGRYGLRGGTDVTGYGLLGHLHEMATAASVAARVNIEAIPALAREGDQVWDLMANGVVPDGTRRTLDHAVAAGWFASSNLSALEQLLLADAQTSGGLLLAVPPKQADGLLADLHAGGDTSAQVVGELVVPAGQLGPGTVTAGRW